MSGLYGVPRPPYKKNEISEALADVEVTKIRVYIDNGNVFEYIVATPEKAREHAAAIVASGYRSTNNQAGETTYWPPHRISKVVCTGGMKTQYPDTILGT